MSSTAIIDGRHETINSLPNDARHLIGGIIDGVCRRYIYREDCHIDLIRCAEMHSQILTGTLTAVLKIKLRMFVLAILSNIIS